MKNFAKFLGIIALVAVIGFSMAACGGEEDDNGGNGGGSISWAGTWKIEGTATYADTFTLGANGVGWVFGDDPVRTDRGQAWAVNNNFNFSGPALLFQDTATFGSLTTIYWYYYERISNTKIRITSGSLDNPLNGVWEKQ
jgi:hypothetical protein